MKISISLIVEKFLTIDKKAQYEGESILGFLKFYKLKVWSLARIFFDPAILKEKG